MRTLRVSRQITALVSVGLLCLGVPRTCLVQEVSADRTRPHSTEVQSEVVDATQTCEAIENLGLSAVGQSFQNLTLSGANQSFQFKCPEGSVLYPVEDPSGKSREILAGARNKVYVVRSAPGSQRTCESTLGQLNSLVPGSILEIKAKANQGLASDPAEQHVFNLTLGEGGAAETHFCYTCTTVAGDTRAAATPKCSIFVAVPPKTTPAPPSEGTDGESQGPTDGQTDSRPDSGSFSQLPWLAPSLGGAAAGLLLRV